MLKYFINSFKRKIARRITKNYPIQVDTFEVENIGTIKFANWQNPLTVPKFISWNNINFFNKFLSQGDLAIDIGANIGQMTVQMSMVTGREGLVLGFDPNPYVFQVLSENAQLNTERSRIEPYNFAITNEEEEFYYHSSEASFNNGGISKTKNSRHGKFTLNTMVKGINLETFLEKKYPDLIDKLKLVKIDTEGYDKEIIKSISRLLLEYKPTVITECFGKNKPEEKFEQFELLKTMGYQLYYFSDFHTDAKIIPIQTCEDMLKWKHFDLYAISHK